MVCCSACLDQRKLFYVKEYLTPKELNEKGLAPVLDAMEVIDYSNPTLSSKKRLLRTLWPGLPFEERFGKFLQKRGIGSFFTQCYSLLVIIMFIVYLHRSKRCVILMAQAYVQDSDTT